ncbi:MAG: choice-of-anchor B family protein [candidate division Zixibacteria bacterium]|nr:choice-of-anchor B family protein [candidate division Zixibacteria bacterium]
MVAFLCAASPVLSRPNFNIDSLFFWEIDNTRGCWGSVDSAGNEYALICATNRLEIWNVTNPKSPGKIRSVFSDGLNGFSADLKQVRPYKNYAVAVNQNGGPNHAALQVIDMTNPSTASTVAVWPDTGNTLPNGAHTIHIEGDSAYLGMNGAADEWYVIDISDPLNPTFKTKYMTFAPVCGNFGAQSHDSYVKNDTAYIAFLGAGFSIVVLGEKPVPKQVADVCYPDAVTHNCWPSEDRQYLFTTDETPGGHLRVWDIRNPANPVQVAEWMPPGIPSIIHNVQVKGDFLYASYYADGVVILDIEDPTQPVEVGHYDVAFDAPPAGNFAGCWDFFPYFPSGTLLASNVSGPPGMWLLRFDTTRAGKLRGTVTNWETGAPIADATVRFLDVPRQTKTDSFGNYLTRTEGGPVRLEYSHPDFRPETLIVNNAVFNDTVAVDTVPLVPISLLPTTPQGLTAQPVDGGDIKLFWQTPPDTNLVAFRIYRTSPSDTTTFSLLASVTPPETSYTDVGTVAGERFLYRITAVNPLFEGFLSGAAGGMRIVFQPKLLLVDRTGPASTLAFGYFRDTIQSFYRRALRRYDFDTLNLRDEAHPLPAGVSPAFTARNQFIFAHSSELRTIAADNPAFLSYFFDFFKAGGKLVMDGHWPLGGFTAGASYLKCFSSEFPFSIPPALWDSLQNFFGFDCLFFPRVFPYDTSLVNRSFLSAQPAEPGYPLLAADSARAAEGLKAYLSPSVPYPYPTVPNVGYFTSGSAGEDLYRFGSAFPGTDPKEGLSVAKRHLDVSTGSGFVWFNFPLFYMREDSAKKAIRRSLADMGLPEDFPKADLNRDGERNPLDVVYLINYAFEGLPFPGFDSDEADLNCDGSVSPADLVLLLLNVFPGQDLPCD